MGSTEDVLDVDVLPSTDTSNDTNPPKMPASQIPKYDDRKMALKRLPRRPSRRATGQAPTEGSQSDDSLSRMAYVLDLGPALVGRTQRPVALDVVRFVVNQSDETYHESDQQMSQDFRVNGSMVTSTQKSQSYSQA